MTTTCVPYDSLERYATGLAPEAERVTVEVHAAACETCRLTLAAVGLAFEPGSAQEEALVAWMATARPVSALLSDLGVGSDPRAASGSQPEPVPGAPARQLASRHGKGRWRAAAGGAVMAIAASVALFLFLPSSTQLVVPHRALQGRPAQLDAHAPFVATRGGSAQSGWESLEASSAAGEDEAATVAILLARGGPGDWERAERLLEGVADGAVLANDRGVLLLAQGHADEALAAFDEALSLDETLVAGLFNRALALEALGRGEDALQAWRRYLDEAAGDAAGWRQEAQAHLAR